MQLFIRKCKKKGEGGGLLLIVLFRSLTLVFKEPDSYYLVSVICSFSSDLVDLALRVSKISDFAGRERGGKEKN